MPKIIYRPNPTPPPFPPPQPPYDDTLFVRINPFEFELNQTVTLNIQQGDFPPFNTFEIWYSNELLQTIVNAFSERFDPSIFGQDIQTVANVNKSDYPYYTALFRLLDGATYRCNVVFLKL